MKQFIQIRCKNNKKTAKVAIGSTLYDVFHELKLDMPYGPVNAKVNNKIEGMHYRLYHNKDVEFLDLQGRSRPLPPQPRSDRHPREQWLLRGS